MHRLDHDSRALVHGRRRGTIERSVHEVLADAPNTRKERSSARSPGHSHRGDDTDGATGGEAGEDGVLTAVGYDVSQAKVAGSRSTSVTERQ